MVSSEDALIVRATGISTWSALSVVIMGYSFSFSKETLFRNVLEDASGNSKYGIILKTLLSPLRYEQYSAYSNNESPHSISYGRGDVAATSHSSKSAKVGKRCANVSCALTMLKM